ncbi:MAG: C40 family peptidase [Actinomycetota bacterium]
MQRSARRSTARLIGAALLVIGMFVASAPASLAYSPPDRYPYPERSEPRPRRGAKAAVAAAYSAIGVKYKWGGDHPKEGFDCSGLTMWSWRHGGVDLPHSSAAQYTATRRVSRANLRPGDLLFFYRPISHVAMYVGGNKMIHARRSGSVVRVDRITSYWWSVYVGAGRPR